METYKFNRDVVLWQKISIGKLQIKRNRLIFIKIKPILGYS